jgi:tRNA nucleotidyltransferase (CCA-adding enzyme)
MTDSDRQSAAATDDKSHSVLLSWSDWQEWALHSETPSRDLHQLRESVQFSHYPELAALVGVPQDPEWHPEGDVWIHTLHVCDATAVIAARDQLDSFDRMVLLFSALCHDLGKATTTEFINGRWHAYQHCAAGVPIAREFLTRIGCDENVIEVVEPLVAEHLVHAQPTVTYRTVRRLLGRLGKATIDQLSRLIEADLKGRPPLPGKLPASIQRLKELAEQLPAVEPDLPTRLVLGRHLIAMGYIPDVWFGQVLEECYQAQLNGTFETEVDGIEFLRQLRSNNQ